MQNSESVKMEATTTMNAAATRSQGDREKGIACSSETMELKGGADDVTEADSVDSNPLALAGHKRKASSEIDPHHRVNSDPLSSPAVEQHAETVPPQGGESEKVEDDKNVPQRGILLDLNQGPEEIDEYLYDDVFKEKVEDNIEVKPEKGELSDFDLNREGGVVDSNNDGDVKPEEDKEILSKMDTEQGEETVNDSVESKEVVPYVVENVVENKQEDAVSLIDEIDEMELTCELNKECDPFSDNDAEKMEVEPCDVAPEKKNEQVENVAEKVEVVNEETMKNEENEVEKSSPVKVGLLRGPLNFDLDLNQLPSMEDD